MSKSLGTGIDPLDVIAEHGADATRYGLLKMSSTQDVRFSYGAVEEGRKLANKLWNVVAADPRERRGRRAGAPAAGRRGALDPRPDRRRARARSRRRSTGVRVLARRERALPAHLRRLLRLVRRGDQAAALRARRRRGGDRARRARAAARAAPPGHAARDRGDLDEPARARDPADRRALARGATGDYGRPTDALERVQDAAAIFRRSGVRVALDGDEQRIFDAVVRPSGVRGGRERRRRDRAAAQGGRARPRGCSRTSASSPNAPAEVVEAEREKLDRYRRELDALGG